MIRHDDVFINSGYGLDIPFNDLSPSRQLDVRADEGIGPYNK